MAIEVHPDTSIVVIAPQNSTMVDIKEKIIRRGKWIVKQQLYFEQFLPKTPERTYVSGETHFYLGKRYLLKLRKSATAQVKLFGGSLVVSTSEVGNNQQVKNLLAGWYYHHARKRFNRLVKASYIKFRKYDFPEPSLSIRRMTKRWGSCTPNGRIILNPEIIKAPSKCIEYVVIHEMCHLVYPNHGKDFFRLQVEIMPDWERWKLKLEKTLI